MNEELRNLLLAVVLSTLVLVAWHLLAGDPVPQSTQSGGIVANTSDATSVQVDKAQAPVEVNSVISRDEAIAASPRLKVQSEHFHGSIALKGLRFDDLMLTGYRNSLDTKSGDVALLSPSRTEQVHFLEFGWISSGAKKAQTPDAQTIWSSNTKVLTPKNPAKLSWTSDQNVKFVVDISVDENYMFQVSQSVENFGAEDIELVPYGLISRNKEEYTDFLISHEGVLGAFDGILFDELTYNEMLDELKEKERKNFESVSGWIAMTDKYWLTSIIPDKSEKFNAAFSYNVVNNQTRYQAEYVGKSYKIVPGQHLKITNEMYVGAKKVDLLDMYAEKYGIDLFDRAIDFGWLYFLTKPIFLALKFFYGFLGNFGLAILLLTVCIKLVLFPLANKGYVAMNKLKALQPDLLQIRERYKDDKVRLQQEMMGLYKREKVNPMSGCFPILIQLPIFFALYKVLFVTIEMRHAPFYGWIKDLSAPDPTSVFNLFGLLPYETPAFLTIGVWPCIMAITMVIQQKLNPPPPDPVQANIIKALPFIFLFMFAHFPAGLIIYWSWSNSISILQQWVISKVLPARRESRANRT